MKTNKGVVDITELVNERNALLKENRILRKRIDEAKIILSGLNSEQPHRITEEFLEAGWEE